MAQTTSIVAQHLPIELSRLVVSFFDGAKMDDEVAHCGLWEHCLNITNLYHGLYGACRSGQMSIVGLMVDMGATDFNGGLKIAATFGHMNVVKFMLRLGANNISVAVCCAIECKHVAILKLLYNRFRCYIDPKTVMIWAGRSSCLRIVRFLLRKRPDLVEDVLAGACSAGQLRTAKYAMQCGAKNVERGLRAASCAGKIELIKLMIKNGANDYDYCLTESCANNYRHIIEYLRHTRAFWCNFCRRSIDQHLADAE